MRKQCKSRFSVIRLAFLFILTCVLLSSCSAARSSCPLSQKEDGCQQTVISVGGEDYLVLSVNEKEQTALLLRNRVTVTEEIESLQIPYSGSYVDTFLETSFYAALKGELGEQAIVRTRLTDHQTSCKEDRKITRHVWLLSLEDVFSDPAQFTAHEEYGFCYDQNGGNTSELPPDSEAACWDLRTSFSTARGSHIQSDGQWGFTCYVPGQVCCIRPAFILKLSEVTLTQTEEHRFAAERKYKQG